MLVINEGDLDKGVSGRDAAQAARIDGMVAPDELVVVVSAVELTEQEELDLIAEHGFDRACRMFGIDWPAEKPVPAAPAPAGAAIAAPDGPTPVQRAIAAPAASGAAPAPTTPAEIVKRLRAAAPAPEPAPLPGTPIDVDSPAYQSALQQLRGLSGGLSASFDAADLCYVVRCRTRAGLPQEIARHRDAREALRQVRAFEQARAHSEHQSIWMVR